MEKLLFAWALSLGLFCDALFNWGVFIQKRSWESRSSFDERRRAGYGPVVRVLLLGLSGAFLLTLASFTVQAYVGGGVAALRDPNGWLQGRVTRRPSQGASGPAPSTPNESRRPSTPARPDPAEPPAEAAEAPPPVPPAGPPEERTLRFFVYEDQGRSFMVDALEKVPPHLRERARELR